MCGREREGERRARDREREARTGHRERDREARTGERERERERRAREREARTFKHGPLADSILESGDAGAWYWLEVGSVHLVCLRFFVIRCILVHNPFSFQLYLHAVDGVMQ